MFNLGELAANVLNSIDNAAKETLEEPKLSATAIRSQRKGGTDHDINDDTAAEIAYGIDDEQIGEVDTGHMENDDMEDYVLAEPSSSVLSSKGSSGLNIQDDMVEHTAQRIETELFPQTSPMREGINNSSSSSSNKAVEAATIYIEKEEPDTGMGENNYNAGKGSDNAAAETSSATVTTAVAAGNEGGAGGGVGRGVGGGIEEVGEGQLSSDLFTPVPHKLAVAALTKKDSALAAAAVDNTNITPAATPTTTHAAASASRPPVDPNVESSTIPSTSMSLSGVGSVAKGLLSSGGSGIGLSLLASGNKGTGAALGSVKSGAVDVGVGVAASGTTSSTASTADVQELKKIIRKKNQVIEKLNRECLELEEQVTALKQEVHEAWDHYKQAQEKAAATESELQDEFTQVQRAKHLEKQQTVAQLTKLQEELAATAKQVTAANNEKEQVRRQLADANEINSQWAQRLTVLEQELMDARAGSAQGVQALREELTAAHRAAEQMRSDHGTLLRQNQIRQTELERENSELSTTVAAQQKELLRLEQLQERVSGLLDPSQLPGEGTIAASNQQSAAFRRSNSGIGGSGSSSSSSNSNSVYMSSDVYVLQQEVVSLSTQLEKVQEDRVELEGQIKLMEREARATQLSADDEKKRSAAVMEELSGKIVDLESRLKAYAQQQQQQQHLRHSKLTGAIPVGVEDFFGSSASSGSDSTSADQQQPGGADSNLVDLTNNANASGVGSTTALGAGSVNVSSGYQYQEVMRELQEQRVQNQNLSKLLLKKQSTLLEVQAEKSALKSKIFDLQERCTEAEQQLAQLRDLEDDVDDYYDSAQQYSNTADTSSATSSSSSSSSSSSGINPGASTPGLQQRKVQYGSSSSNTSSSLSSGGRRRGRVGGAAAVLTDLERFGVKPGAGVANAVNLIDGWTLFTGRVLRMNPLVRMGFVLYLLALHLWVLLILVIHTHSLDITTDAHEQLLH